ncbi:hypothetical protein C8R44DRAFT_751038 [Mycena epipterygia]|nr:hypothetical protein C8R44DRAFT_751038 [Mycena epipterygia]
MSDRVRIQSVGITRGNSEVKPSQESIYVINVTLRRIKQRRGVVTRQERRGVVVTCKDGSELPRVPIGFAIVDGVVWPGYRRPSFFPPSSETSPPVAVLLINTSGRTCTGRLLLGLRIRKATIPSVVDSPAAYVLNRSKTFGSPETTPLTSVGSSPLLGPASCPVRRSPIIPNAIAVTADGHRLIPIVSNHLSYTWFFPGGRQDSNRYHRFLSLVNVIHLSCHGIDLMYSDVFGRVTSARIDFADTIETTWALVMRQSCPSGRSHPKRLDLGGEFGFPDINMFLHAGARLQEMGENLPLERSKISKYGCL